MNANQLLAHYERIADAPEAVPRLRRFILTLAVRGKLVEQDPNDEPATELLNRIAEEKARLVKAGEFREPRNAVEIKRDELPFVPAVHWEWSRLIDIARPSYGFAFQSSEFNTDKRGMPLIRIRDISKTDTVAYYEGDFDPTYLVRAGDYLVGMDGDFNLLRWQGLDGLLNQRVMRINGWRCDVDSEFVKLPLQMVLDYLHGVTSLTTVKHLSAKQVNGIGIPLPPLPEQHRIVSKVDELMALCDRLEAARTERESTRDRMAAASLVRLNDPDPDRVVFRNHAAFALENLAPLTTRTDQIKALRQTILNLAVRGKLVEQDPNDEPASELLKQVREVRSRKISQRTLKRTKDLFPASGEPLGLALPEGWIFSRLGTVYDVRDGTHDTPKYVDHGVPLVTSKNLSKGVLSFDDVKVISEADHRHISERSKVAQDDILLAMIGSIGNPVIVETTAEFSIKNVALFKYFDRGLSCPQYLRYFLMFASGEMKELASGGLQPFVSLSFLRNYIFPVPPLAEQHRIVAKVDELMALCDRVEANLATGDDTRRRLLDALLHEVLPAHLGSWA